MEIIELTYFKFIWFNLINLYYNLKIRYKPDIKNYGKKEYWTKGVSKGDCEDYAIAKLVYLIMHNKNNEYNSKNLCLAECYTENKKTGKPGYGDCHLVLMLFTDKGYFVMDNRNMFLACAKRLRYIFTKVMYNGSWMYYEKKEIYGEPNYYRFNKTIITKIIFNFYYLIKSFIFGIPDNRNFGSVFMVLKETSPPHGYTELKNRLKSGIVDFKEEYEFFKFIENEE